MKERIIQTNLSISNEKVSDSFLQSSDIKQKQLNISTNTEKGQIKNLLGEEAIDEREEIKQDIIDRRFLFQIVREKVGGTERAIEVLRVM